MFRSTSEKKQAQIDAHMKTPLEIGESIYVHYNDLNKGSLKKDKLIPCSIISLDPLTVKESGYTSTHIITEDEIAKRSTLHIGANPFAENSRKVQSVAFALDSILHTAGIVESRDDRYDIKGVPIMDCNWNPFVYDADGNKNYYQRDFVWTLENKQNLIESIYNHVDCGKILIRLRDWNELEPMQAKGETELSFKDIVDGKQRLDAVRGFIMNEYPDKHGNYYGDLSQRAQRQLTDHQLFSYSEMRNVSDAEVLAQFLKMNFEGVPQSTEHLDFVRSLYEHG